MEEKVKKIILVACNLLTAIILISCGNNSINKTPLVANNQVQNDTTPHKSFEIRRLDPKFYYQTKKLSDTTYSIEWGKKGVNKYTSNKVFEISGSGMLTYLTSNDSVIILSQSCGTSCTYFVLLSLNRDKIMTYDNPEALNLNKNLIAYVSDPDNDGQIVLTVENYINGKKMIVKVNNVCPSAIKYSCIEECYFEHNTLIIKWDGSKWQSSKPDLQVKRIPITI